MTEPLDHARGELLACKPVSHYESRDCYHIEACPHFVAVIMRAQKAEAELATLRPAPVTQCEAEPDWDANLPTAEDVRGIIPRCDAEITGLPKPETMLTYASILEKPQYWIDPKTDQKYQLATGEIIEAACATLRYCAALSPDPGTVADKKD